MSPLRIVLVMIDPPIPFGNAAARWYYVLVRGLVARGHRVTAFVACGKPAEMDEARALFPAPDFDVRLFPFPVRGGFRAKAQTLAWPFSYMFGADLIKELDETLAQGFDILHLEQLWSAWLGLAHPDRSLVNVHFPDADRPIRLGAETLAGERTARRLAASCREPVVAVLQYTRILRAVSPRLADEIRRVNPRADVTSVPLGIDASLYRFIPDEDRSPIPIVTLIGTMGWRPTQSAALRLLTKLWPEIKRRVPDARLQIVGWSARAALADFLKLPDVTIEENVPSTQPYFESASLLLYAPSRGSGMKIKIQEAMAFGVPVVTTSEGVEGLPATDGLDAGIAEDDEGLIERSVTLLQSPELQNRQRRAARQLIETHCGPGPTVDAIESLYQGIVGAAGSGGFASR